MSNLGALDDLHHLPESLLRNPHLPDDRIHVESSHLATVAVEGHDIPMAIAGADPFFMGCPGHRLLGEIEVLEYLAHRPAG